MEQASLRATTRPRKEEPILGSKQMAVLQAETLLFPMQVERKCLRNFHGRHETSVGAGKGATRSTSLKIPPSLSTEGTGVERRQRRRGESAAPITYLERRTQGLPRTLGREESQVVPPVVAVST